jgi:hypothetical protein
MNKSHLVGQLFIRFTMHGPLYVKKGNVTIERKVIINI